MLDDLDVRVLLLVNIEFDHRELAKTALVVLELVKIALVPEFVKAALDRFLGLAVDAVLVVALESAAVVATNLVLIDLSLNLLLDIEREVVWHVVQDLPMYAVPVVAPDILRSDGNTDMDNRRNLKQANDIGWRRRVTRVSLFGKTSYQRIHTVKKHTHRNKLPL